MSDSWVTKEGKEIKISQMNNGHLCNAIRLLRRKGVTAGNVRYDAMMAEADKRELDTYKVVVTREMLRLTNEVLSQLGD